MQDIITLIKPPLLISKDIISSHSGVPPIGLAYVAASVKKAGYQVKVIDAHGEAVHKFTKFKNDILLVNGILIPEIIEKIPQESKIIGISCMFSNEWPYTKKVIREIIRIRATSIIVIGGEHTTAEPERSLRESGAHFCVLGEGDETFVELVRSIYHGKPKIQDVQGIAFIKNKLFIKTPPRKRKRNLDELPLPAWEEMPIENYLAEGFGLSIYNKRSMPLLASRGCPYLCTFCTNENMWEPKWYSRSPQLVADEIELYKNKYNIDNVDFFDLTTVIDKQWVLKFCEIMKQRNLKLTLAFPAGTRSEALTSDVLKALRDAGLVRMQYAPESGSPATLARIKKRVNLKKMTHSMRESVKLGMITKATLIFGFPDQTKWEVIQSFTFLIKMAFLGVHDVACFHFVPYPGSELFLSLGKDGRFKSPQKMDEFEYESFVEGNLCNRARKMVSYSQYIGHSFMPILTIGGMAFFYFLQFLIRPWRIWRICDNLFKGTPLSMFETTLYGIYLNFIKGRRFKSSENSLAPIFR